MASAADWRDARAFSVGAVMGRAFAVMRDHPLPIFGIAFLFGALPQQLLRLFIQPFGSPDAMAALGVIFTGVSTLVSLFLGSLVAGAIVRVTMASAEGGTVSFGESVATGLAKALPLFALTLLMAIGLGLGFLLLLVPGVILLVLWSVAPPALVAEDLGVIEAFGRSRALTKGARWRVFGLGLVILLIFWALFALVGTMFVFNGGLPYGAASLPFMLFSTVTGTVSSAFLGTVQTSLYLALRDWKDGPKIGELADVFA